MRNMVGAAAVGLLVLSLQNDIHAQSQAEYARERLSAWKETEAQMEQAFSRLLAELENEPNKEPAQQLRESKAKWEEFRSLFCESVARTYGGAWISVNESECRVKLAQKFTDFIGEYGW